ncbi:hypothetical protein BJF90_15995 [Pseudonocardia sp. CNS-004]|nr:hypothetical protein BJF90_15995 [Pseudonocardia sp. CNS-004]
MPPSGTSGAARSAGTGCVTHRRSFPTFDPDGTLAELRRSEYGRLDATGQVYLDCTGGGMHAASQIERHAELMRTRVLGNPHSNNPTSLAATELVQQARRLVCEFFNAPPEEYPCLFTANASAALRLVGEACKFGPRGTFALTFDNHNSVNGIREYARRAGAGIAYVPVVAPDLRLDRAAMTDVLRSADPAARNLLAFPAQSNFSGVQYDLDLVDEAHDAGWDVLVDAAAFARPICLICLALMWSESVLGLCLGCEIHGLLVRRGWVTKDEAFEICVNGVCDVPGPQQAAALGAQSGG